MDIAEISDRMELEKLVTDYATAVDTKILKSLIIYLLMMLTLTIQL